MNDFDEKTIGAFDVFSHNFVLQEEKEIGAADSEEDETPALKEAEQGQEGEASADSIPNVNTESAKEEELLEVNKEEEPCIELDDCGDEDTLNAFGEASFIENAKKYHSQKSSDEADEVFDKTVEIFGNDSNISRNKAGGFNKDDKINSQKSIEQKDDNKSSGEIVSNNNSKTEKKAKSGKKTIFLVLAILLLFVTIVTIPLFPVTVVFAILDVICFVIFFILKNKSKK